MPTAASPAQGPVLSVRQSGEQAEPGFAVPHLYRKTPLFERFIKFRVHVERPEVRH